MWEGVPFCGESSSQHHLHWLIGEGTENPQPPSSLVLFVRGGQESPQLLSLATIEKGRRRLQIHPPLALMREIQGEHPIFIHLHGGQGNENSYSGSLKC